MEQDLYLRESQLLCGMCGIAWGIVQSSRGNKCVGGEGAVRARLAKWRDRQTSPRIQNLTDFIEIRCTELNMGLPRVFLLFSPCCK